MAFGETLANLRKAKGLSQEQLAEEIKLTRQTISKWELNQSIPDIDYLFKLSDFFDVSTDYLIKGENADEGPTPDRADFESRSAENSEIKSNNTIAYKWCFYLGSVTMAVALIGIAAFVICSALNPWGATVNNWYFEGLLAFLIGTNTLWFFIMLSVLFVAGCVLSVYGIIKNIRLKK